MLLQNPTCNIKLSKGALSISGMLCGARSSYVRSVIILKHRPDCEREGGRERERVRERKREREGGKERERDRERE